MAAKREASFLAIADTRTRVLILGSLPGAVSLERRQYYANPTNQFWRLIGVVTGTPFAAMTYEMRVAALLDARIGLWDVIKSAQRSGSLDSSIRDHSANALLRQARALPSLRAIAFNGGKAAAIGRKQMGAAADAALLSLPSSSAAYCAMSFQRKAEEWALLQPFLTE